VVEDDPDVRDLAVSVLDRLGYQVVEAPDGKSAIEILQRPDRIHLILSDVVLPGGISGPDLVAKGKGWQPNVKALFMSGYATDALSEADQHDTRTGLLNKPFHRAELAERVRATLDEPETGS
jgi:CheY-like chemotaxis protein